MTESSSIKSPAALIDAARRVVVKVGSALIIDAQGEIRADWMDALVDDLVAMKNAGAEICVVSSGAIGVGARRLPFDAPMKLEEKQAAAAVGQPLLAEAWRSAFERSGGATAQILLTLADMESRRRYLNARATLETLFQVGVTPIVNENDTTATDEIRYGDNDRLAAHVAQTCGADLLLMLSDIDGLYDRDPRVHPDARHIPVVQEITATHEASAGGPNARRGAGAGGMRTKLAAAKIAAGAGCATLIARGDAMAPISALCAGARATFFAATETPENARRSWIAGRLNPEGAVHIDDGAVAALSRGASLLSAGVTRVDGPFEKGDAIAILDTEGAPIGQGLSAYSSAELSQVLGLKSAEVEAVLGFRRSAAVHRNDLVLLNANRESET